MRLKAFPDFAETVSVFQSFNDDTFYDIFYTFKIKFVPIEIVNRVFCFLFCDVEFDQCLRFLQQIGFWMQFGMGDFYLPKTQFFKIERCNIPKSKIIAQCASQCKKIGKGVVSEADAVGQ